MLHFLFAAVVFSFTVAWDKPALNEDGTPFVDFARYVICVSDAQIDDDLANANCQQETMIETAVVQCPHAQCFVAVLVENALGKASELSNQIRIHVTKPKRVDIRIESVNPHATSFRQQRVPLLQP